MIDGTPQRRRSTNYVGWAILGSLMIAAIILPYLLWGPQLEAATMSGLETVSRRPALLAPAVVVVLASDVVLPVPSSAVGVFAGATLGWPLGTLTVWLGLMIGGLVGYALGRGAGGPLVGNGPTERAPAGVGGASRRDVLALAATRAVPVLAEMGVIAAGAARMPLRRFVIVTAISNAPVAFAYACIGAFLPIAATIAALALTIGLAILWSAAMLFRTREG